jgi:5'-deoxynucleotidase YfbR-like HD superfamily hydrolase
MTALLQRMSSGKMVNILDLDHNHVDVEDIAHNLSHQCRFNGGTREHYSVAQHSILVAERVWYRCLHEQPSDPVRHTRRALMHDASEAYLGDVVRPLKYTDPFVEYRVVEARTQTLIEHALGVLPEASWRDLSDEYIRAADDGVLALECQQLFTPAYYPQKEYQLGGPGWWRPIEPWPAGHAKRLMVQCWENPAVYFSVHGFFNQLELPWRNDV